MAKQTAEVAEWGATEHTAIGNGAPHSKYTNAEAVSAVNAAGLNLASGKVVQVTSALIEDHTRSGITAIMTCAEDLVRGDVVYTVIGKMAKADADSPLTMPGIALHTGLQSSADALASFLLLGYFRDDTWNWTAGEYLYVGTTPGELTQTRPSGLGDQVQVLGIAITANIIFFCPSLELVEIS